MLWDAPEGFWNGILDDADYYDAEKDVLRCPEKPWDALGYPRMPWDALGCSGMPWDAAGMLWRDSKMRCLVMLILMIPKLMPRDALGCSGMLWDALGCSGMLGDALGCSEMLRDTLKGFQNCILGDADYDATEKDALGCWRDAGGMLMTGWNVL